jgi:hypothetical protein
LSSNSDFNDKNKRFNLIRQFERDSNNGISQEEFALYLDLISEKNGYVFKAFDLNISDQINKNISRTNILDRNSRPREESFEFSSAEKSSRSRA